MITTCRSDHHPPIHVLHTLLPAVALVPRAAWALCGNSSARRSEIIRESARESTSDTTRAYQVRWYTTAKLAWSSFNQTVCALRFLYSKTLGKDWNMRLHPVRQAPQEAAVGVEPGPSARRTRSDHRPTAPRHRDDPVCRRAARFRGGLAADHRRRQPAHAAACPRQGRQGSSGDVVTAAAVPLALPLPTLSARDWLFPSRHYPTGTSPGTRWLAIAAVRHVIAGKPVSPHTMRHCLPICWNPAPICAPSRPCSDTPSIRSTAIYTPRHPAHHGAGEPTGVVTTAALSYRHQPPFHGRPSSVPWPLPMATCRARVSAGTTACPRRSRSLSHRQAWRPRRCRAPVVRCAYRTTRAADPRHCPKCQAHQRAKWLEDRCQVLFSRVSR